jgi:CPA2 family monovalent cation:H+ antiporter-2
VPVALGAIAVLAIAPRHGPLVSKAPASDEPESLLLGVPGVTILVTGVANQLKVSAVFAAVGAFLVGIAISDEVAEHAQTLPAPLRDLLAAAFFVSYGLSTDPPVDLPPLLLPAAVLTVVTALTKTATGYWAARRGGLAKPGRYRAGGALVVARGEFSIVIAGLAVAAEARLGRRPRRTC